MNDERRTIGTTGAAGRGGKGSSPSSAARSLAGGAAAPRKPVTKKTPPQDTDKPVATKAPAKKAAAKKATATKAPAKKTAAKKAPAASSGPQKTSAPPRAARPTASKAGPRLRAVTDEDAARAAAEAAEEAARETRTAGAASLPGIPVEDMVLAVVHAAQRILGSDWERRLATAVSALRKRLAGDYEVDEFGFDREITEVMVGAVEPLAEKWFRLEVRGAENIPTDGGALLVANHSGTVPIDGIITGYAVKKYTGRDLRPLGADLVFALPFVGQVARKFGISCVNQCDKCSL